MNELVALPVLIPLVGASLCILLGRSRAAQRAVSLIALTATTVLSVVLLVAADRDGPLVVQSGGWPAPIGITLVVDRLSGIMLTVGSLMLLAVLVFAIGQPGAERNHVGFQSTYLILAAGVAGSFVVGDLFTLFVSFEMMLTASYVLLTLGGGREQVRSGMTYVVISLLASTLFITALALLYAATGTVNMADLAVKLDDLPDGLGAAFAVLLVVVFGIKAGLFPLFSWLPDSYPVAPSAVTAVFAGLLTKVGVYALIRTQTLLFGPDDRPATLLLVLAGLTMVVGILGAIAQDDVKRILSFNIVSHIGYMVMGSGVVLRRRDRRRRLLHDAPHRREDDVVPHRRPDRARRWLVAAQPPRQPGALGAGHRRAVPRAGAGARRGPAVLRVRAEARPHRSGVRPGRGHHRRRQPRRQPAHGAVDDEDLAERLLGRGDRAAPGVVHRVGVLGGPSLMVAPTAVLAAVSIAIAVAAGPLYRLCERAATELLDRAGYVQAVLG